MERNVKVELVNILKELARGEELVISNSETEKLLSGEDISIVLIKGDVIHIYLSESIFVRRERRE